MDDCINYISNKNLQCAHASTLVLNCPPPLLQAAKVADALTRDVHYTVDEKQKSVLLTEDGYEAVEDVLQVGLGGIPLNWTHECIAGCNSILDKRLDLP